MYKNQKIYHLSNELPLFFYLDLSNELKGQTSEGCFTWRASCLDKQSGDRIPDIRGHLHPFLWPLHWVQRIQLSYDYCGKWGEGFKDSSLEIPIVPGCSCHDFRGIRLPYGLLEKQFMVFYRLQLPHRLLGHSDLHLVHWVLALDYQVSQIPWQRMD